MPLTDDPTDPRLTHGADEHPVGLAAAYLVLSAEERAKGFIRPVRRSYVHVGTPGPVYPLRDLTDDEATRHAGCDYVKYEEYLRYVPAGAEYPPYDPDSSVVGRFWTRAQLDAVGLGCGAVTTMATAIAETYARSPQYYGATYCVGCQMHRSVGRDGEFVWDGTTERVGT